MAALSVIGLGLMMYWGFPKNDKSEDIKQKTNSTTCYYQMDYNVIVDSVERDPKKISERNNTIKYIAKDIDALNRSYYAIEIAAVVTDDSVYFPSICDINSTQKFLDFSVKENGFERFMEFQLMESSQQQYTDLVLR